MIHIILAIRDIKTNAYFTPQYVKSVSGFVRQLGDDINSPNIPENTLASTMARHPEDFEVKRLGTWDDETAQTYLEEHTQVCVLSTLKDTTK